MPTVTCDTSQSSDESGMCSRKEISAFTWLSFKTLLVFIGEVKKNHKISYRMIFSILMRT